MRKTGKFAKKLLILTNNNLQLPSKLTRLYTFDSCINDYKPSGEKILKSNVSGIYPAIC